MQARAPRPASAAQPPRRAAPAFQRARRRRTAAAASSADGPSSSPQSSPFEARLEELAERLEQERSRAVMRDALEDQRRLREAAREFWQGGGGGGDEGAPPRKTLPQRVLALLRAASQPPPRTLLDPDLAVPATFSSSSSSSPSSDLDAQVEAAEMERRRRSRAEKEARRRAAVASPAAWLLACLALAALVAQWWPLLGPVAAYVQQAGPLEAWTVLKASLWTYPETPATALLQYTVELTAGGGGGGGAAAAAAGGGGVGGWWRLVTSGLLGSGLVGGALVARGLAKSAWWIDACAPYGGGAGSVFGAYVLSCLGACFAGGGALQLMVAGGGRGGVGVSGDAAATAAVLAGPGTVVGMHVAWLLLALRLRRAWQRERLRAGPSVAATGDSGGGGTVDASMVAAAAEARAAAAKVPSGAGAGAAGAAAADAKALEEGWRMFQVVDALAQERTTPLVNLPESFLPPVATASGVATCAALAALSFVQPAANAASLLGGAVGGAAAAALSDPLSSLVGAAARAPLFLALATLRVGARIALSAAGVLLAFVIATARGLRAAVQTIRGGV
jgi:hypothetical protein